MPTTFRPYEPEQMLLLSPIVPPPRKRDVVANVL